MVPPQNHQNEQGLRDMGSMKRSPMKKPSGAEVLDGVRAKKVSCSYDILQTTADDINDHGTRRRDASHPANL